MEKIYIVCYPGGAGGTFVAAALQSVIFGSSFEIDAERGHCHDNTFVSLPHCNHGDSIESFEEELDNIKKLRLAPSSVYSGHYRNLVAIHSLIHDGQNWELAQNIRFIKINVQSKSNHVTFLANMLRKKQNSFPELSMEKFIEQTQLYIDSWYWIENARTVNTINLDLTDVFTLGIENKFKHHLTDSQLEKLAQYQRDYVSVQHSLYPEVMKLLYDTD